MQTKLSAEFEGTPEGAEAEAILRKCVHCGFCNATCPTYQLLGDELDGPRGRIYLIKEMLEGHDVTERTQRHLDRCLTCRNCETTCPSGVRYGHLVEIGRHLVERRVARPLHEKAGRWFLKEGLTSPLFGPALRVGRLLRPLLPRALRAKVPAGRSAEREDFQPREHRRKVLLLGGCVQPAMRPQIHRATRRVLDAAGIQTLFAAGEGCCGALRTHLADRDGGLQDMRRNIDAWWPMVSSGMVEFIVVNASGCGQMVKEYAHALRDEPGYAERAARIVSMTRDLGELLPELALTLKDRIRSDGAPRLAFHSPCTLQHGQRISGLDAQLRAVGFDVREGAESHLCCGSAGTYSVLQPELASALRDRKLAHLAALEPECIVSANIGCIQHLASGTATPVKHWIEVLDDALTGER
ncbi:MAG TPA: glycolate oxidase subunit GlcF [Steroidobacteraceae bacterium]|nr:glycolate oxidase subunit GlcF [Steroidobacteraceae bacterium]